MYGVQAINSANISNISNVRFKGGDIKDIQSTNLLSKDAKEDSLELRHKKGEYDLTKEDKQEIIRKARTTASGWAIFGGPISTLYFALRSDEAIAKKYDLDINSDKKLIKQIKNQQTVWTLPAVIPGINFLTSLIPWIYNKNMDPSGINVKE